MKKSTCKVLIVAAVVILIILVPGILENARMMRSQQERLQRDATRRVTPRKESAPRRSRKR